MYTFGEIVENKEIIRFLRRSIEYGKVSHAYVIDGREGIGKELLANTFAKALQCEAEGIEPCGVCISCRTFDAKNNPDVIYVTPEKTKYLSVQDIRKKLNSDTEIRPYRNKYKIYILTGTEKMSPGAQNALLKTLEEPPSYVVIMLLSNNANSFLPTILSRCVMIRLKPLKTSTVEKFLLCNNVPEYKAAIAALYSMGSIGRGLTIATDEEFSQMRESMLNIATSIYKKDLIELFLLYKEFEPFKEAINDCLDIMNLWFRDVLVVKELGIDYAMQKDKLDELLFQADTCSIKGILNTLDILAGTKRQLSYNANFQLSIEMMLINIKKNITH